MSQGCHQGMVNLCVCECVCGGEMVPDLLTLVQGYTGTLHALLHNTHTSNAQVFPTHTH